MRRVTIAAVATIVVLLVVSQVAIPRFLQGEVEKRLEQDGGTAKASISAFPAVTLLGGRGRSIDIDGSGLTYDLDQRDERPFDRLDGFGRVNVELRDLNAGPVRLSSFVLTRENRDSPYELTALGTTTPSELAGELGSSTGGQLGGLLGSLATGLLSDRATMSVPLALRASVNSVDGKADVASANASVAGVPAGPLTLVVLRSVLDRL